MIQLQTSQLHRDSNFLFITIIAPDNKSPASCSSTRDAAKPIAAKLWHTKFLVQANRLGMTLFHRCGQNSSVVPTRTVLRINAKACFQGILVSLLLWLSLASSLPYEVFIYPKA